MKPILTALLISSSLLFSSVAHAADATATSKQAVERLFASASPEEGVNCGGKTYFATLLEAGSLRLQVVWEDSVFFLIDDGVDGTPDALDDPYGVSPSDWIREQVFGQYRRDYADLAKCAG